MEEKKLTGYPSIDKPWLKYYSEEAINALLPECTMYEYVWNNNKDHLNDVAIVYFGRKLTYKELFGHIDQTAAAFSKLGVKQGDVVTIQSLSVPQVVFILYALSKIGAVANLVYANNGAAEVKANLVETGCRVWVVMEPIFHGLKKDMADADVDAVIVMAVQDEMDLVTKTVYSMASKAKKLQPEEKTLPWKDFYKTGKGVDVPVQGKSSDPVVMVYTGGTTGKSKAVILSNYNLNVSALQCSYYGIERQNRFLSALPPFIAFGVALAIHMPLFVGLKTIIGVSTDLSEMAGLVTKYRPNYLICGTLQAEKMLNTLKNKKNDLSFLKWLVIGGDCLSNKLEDELNAWLQLNNSNIKVTQGYAMSETTASTAISVYTHTKRIYKSGTVGIPLVYTNLKIVDVDTGKELPYGAQGEICINTPCTMLGYYNDEAETDNVIKMHSDGKLWVHTGDVGCIDEEGFVSIVGRIKRMIVVLENAVYHKVFPKIAEEMFLQSKDIQAISIVGKPNSKNIHELIAFVVLKKGVAESEVISTLEKAAIENLEPYERPAKYIIKDKLPRTTIGKVDYRALEKEAEKI